jgi:predicted alternative tryptophan synthase beta-subunit
MRERAPGLKSKEGDAKIARMTAGTPNVRAARIVPTISSTARNFIGVEDLEGSGSHQTNKAHPLYICALLVLMPTNN